MLSNTNNSLSHYLFICIQLNGFKYYYYYYLVLIIQFSINHLSTHSFKYSKWLNTSIWPLDGTLTGTITLDQNGLGNIGNEGVTPHSPKFQDLSLTIRCNLVHSLRWRGLTSLQPQLTGLLSKLKKLVLMHFSFYDLVRIFCKKEYHFSNFLML